MRPNEHTKIVILADLGTMKAFRVSPPNDPLNPHQGPCTIEEVHLPAHERNTDRPGRFPLGREAEEAIPLGAGENHHEEAENEKRRLHFIAEEIEAILKKEDGQLWCLAAPATINKRLLELLSPETRDFLATNIKADLTHINKRELERRFVHTSTTA